jgi:hypothetical protein
LEHAQRAEAQHTLRLQDSITSTGHEAAAQLAVRLDDVIACAMNNSFQQQSLNA